MSFMTVQSIPLYWRLKRSKYNLVGTKCATCSTLFFPPRAVCPKCRRRGQLEEFQFAGNGKIITWTIIRIAPVGFENQSPYAVAIVQLDEGPMISGQVVGDISKMETGKTVRKVFRKMHEDDETGLIHYGLKWEIVE